jgi:plasmid stabilization system protein ParE
MSHSLNVTSRARRDISVIMRYITERSKRGADSWYRKLGQTLDSIVAMPESFGLAPEDEDHDETIRQAIFKTRKGLPYRAIFLVRGSEVFVVHVLGSGQDNLGQLQLPRS